jgi:hypothetical protein
MHVASVVLFDQLADLRRAAAGAGKADNVVARPRKGRGEFGAKTFGYAGDKQKRTGSGTPVELASDPEVRRVYLGEAFRLDEPSRTLPFYPTPQPFPTT